MGMATVAAPVAEQRVTIHASWELYERILAEHPEAAGPRFTYSDGILEILVLSAPHEEPNRTLAALVEVLTAEFGMDVRRLGSTTFKREELRKGFEPDSGFYIAHAAAVRGRDVDPTVDPPPDLVIEIDISRSSLPRFPIFAAFGVPEVWRYDGERVSIWRLAEGRYVEAGRSEALAPLTAAMATRFLEESRTLGSAEWYRRVREWARAQR